MESVPIISASDNVKLSSTGNMILDNEWILTICLERRQKAKKKRRIRIYLCVIRDK